MTELVEPKTLEELQDRIINNETVIVEFGASWCGPCKKFLPHFTEFAARNPDVVCVKVDVDDDPAFLSEYKIQSVPQVMLFVGSEYVKHLQARTVIKLTEELASS